MAIFVGLDKNENWVAMDGVSLKGEHLGRVARAYHGSC